MTRRFRHPLLGHFIIPQVLVILPSVIFFSVTNRSCHPSLCQFFHMTRRSRYPPLGQFSLWQNFPVIHHQHSFCPWQDVQVTHPSPVYLPWQDLHVTWIQWVMKWERSIKKILFRDILRLNWLIVLSILWNFRCLWKGSIKKVDLCFICFYHFILPIYFLMKLRVSIKCSRRGEYLYEFVD